MRRFTWTLSQVAVYARSVKPAMCEGRTFALRFCIITRLSSVERSQFLELLPPFLLPMTLICRHTWTRSTGFSLRLLTQQHIYVQGHNEVILFQRIFSTWPEASALDYPWSSPQWLWFLDDPRIRLMRKMIFLLVSRAVSRDVLSHSSLTWSYSQSGVRP